MSAVYLLGAKEIESKKKKGQSFYPLTFLHTNHFGDWETVVKFAPSVEVFEAVLDSCVIGQAVSVQLTMSGDIVCITPLDDVEPLPLPDLSKL